MAGSSLFALIDDIATILDDVGAMSKVAVEKTAGVLGDDLALNAQQITGVNPNRELPVVWAVAKGSLLNKVILVPAALGISAIAPWAVSPLLMIGGAFLCFEGFEKIIHKFLHPKKKEEQQQERTEALKALADPQTDLVKVEKSKIAGAIRTDFILSAEIVVIALGTLAATTFAMRVAVLSTIAIVMTAGVYGLVAAIIKMDDLGLFLSKRQGTSGMRAFERWVGRAILVMAPYLLRLLSIVGTAAMFLVGGHILMAGVPALHHWYEETVHHLAEVPTVGFLLEFFAPIVIDGGAGILAGATIVLVVESIKRVLWKKSSSHH